MSSVGVRELKNRLTHYLRLAKQGDDVVVTERGRPIALIQAIERAASPRREGRLAQLAATGRLVLPTAERRWKGRPVRIAGPPASQTVLEDRR